VTFRPLLASFLLIFLMVPGAYALETKARAALLVDYNTGTVLLEKNADQALPPASMSKLMTLNMVFEALEDGRLSMDERLPVSEHAMSYGGSTMFLNTRDRVRVEDLIRGVIVLSGNDACAVLAEALAGSEAEFARAMTKRARQLGMMNSTFANSNGWPHRDQRMSARDLVILAERLIRHFPQYYGYFGEREFAFDDRSPANRFNRNPLLKLDIGADGLKTGHTTEAGYGVVGSATKNGRRVVLMLTGLDTEADRAREAEKLVNWAFRQFLEKKILTAGQVVETAEVWMGRESLVTLRAAHDLDLLLPVSASRQLTAEITLNLPIEAPIEQGAELAIMKITIPGMQPVEVPLVAGEAVARSGFLSRLRLSAAILGQSVMTLGN
jgi:D-alanyl-D-alanine carboxypeptidase (penicillin-binding protein 5/6)